MLADFWFGTPRPPRVFWRKSAQTIEREGVGRKYRFARVRKWLVRKELRIAGCGDRPHGHAKDPRLGDFTTEAAEGGAQR